jgi:hypothetical protein
VGCQRALSVRLDNDLIVLTAEAAARYLTVYAEKYQRESERLTAEPPEGGGFPTIVFSPYCEDADIVCFLAVDGAAVLDQSHEPSYDWAIAGGPALMVDWPDPDSRVPLEIIEDLRKEGLLGKPIGIYRICFEETPVPDEIWQGVLPDSIEEATATGESGPSFNVRRVDLRWTDLIERLTFGAYGRILDLHLPSDAATDFWQPTVVRDCGFITADRVHRRWFHQLGLIRHLEESAWDPRSAWARAKVDVRRDTVIRRPGSRYTVVELERPGKLVATKRGHARAEVTQASFQIAEFKDYIVEHYDLLKEVFPGINRDPALIVVISRSTEASFGGRGDTHRQLQLLREQLGVDELLTYDDLLDRARAALARLSGLSPAPTP